MNNLLANMYYQTNYSYNYSEAEAAALLGSVIVMAAIIGLASYVFSAIFLGLIFKKAGQPIWKAWVPLYNSWVLLELGKQKGAYILFILIPFVGPLIASIFVLIAQYHIGLKLGKTGAFVLWAIFLNPVWLVWLAIDDSKWGDKAVTA